MATSDSQRQPPAEFTLACPIPPTDYPNILLGHGGGGKLTHALIEKIFVPAFANKFLDTRHDGAVIEIGERRVAYTTDSYVVQPLFFPGGDIGKLAVYGTVNDLAMCGARPLFLSAGLVLEEGLPMETLWRVVCSMRDAAEAAGVQIVTGDTKVVDRGKGDQVFINTSGVGLIEHNGAIAPDGIRPGDAVILSGDIGRHGMAIMASREGLEFESAIESDCAPLAGLVLDLMGAGLSIHCMRDLTRGGLASALIEIAARAKRRIDIDEGAITVREDVRGACEILGLDPLYVANEGRFIAFVPEAETDRATSIMRAHAEGKGARVVGRVTDENQGIVTMKTAIGGSIILDMFSGEQLPRIC
jgi:hydrogenase expression/formation protein HypE